MLYVESWAFGFTLNAVLPGLDSLATLLLLDNVAL